MRRWVAIGLSLLLALASGQLAALHVHAYADHDHPEHHHGPAAHDHHHQPAKSPDDLPHLEACDAAAHAVSFALSGITNPHTVVAAVEASAMPGLARPIEPRIAPDRRDVRVHGPPERAQSPPRAPPHTSRL